MRQTCDENQVIGKATDQEMMFRDIPGEYQE